MELMPGYCKSSANKRIKDKRRLDTNRFIGNIAKPIAHIGSGDFLNLDGTEYINCKDFNFDLFPYKKYNTILCFEILEHLQNPLFFLKQIKSIMSADAVLYLSTPNRIKWLRPLYHYNEISAKHLERWLLAPLNLEIIKKKRLYIRQSWFDYFIGVRPLARAIKSLNFKPIILNLTNTTWIYKIQSKN